ncbi:unnamed protein product, partial [marine sediment metagenome]
MGSTDAIFSVVGSRISGTPGKIRTYDIRLRRPAPALRKDVS